MKNITIGIPARNEENTIIRTLESVVKSTFSFIELFDIKAEIIVGLNGCVDKTEEKVDIYYESIKKDYSNIIFFKIITDEGLVKTQNTIYKQRKYSGTIFFFDADVLLEEHCIQEMYKTLFTNSEFKIVWASVAPYDFVESNNKFRFKHIYNYSDYYTKVMTGRKQLHGRAFCVNSYPNYEDDKNRKKINMDNKKHQCLQLDMGVLVDDIYLSRYYYHKYGITSIANSKNAIVYFNPILTIQDFYYGQRRTVMEMYRLDVIFPNQKEQGSKYLKRELINKEFRKITYTQKLQYYIYRVIYFSSRKLAKVEMYLKLYMYSKSITTSKLNIWKPLKTTKKYIK